MTFALMHSMGALSNWLALCICKVLLWIPKCQQLHGGSEELPKHSPTGRWGRRGCAHQGANIYISNMKSLLPLPQHQRALSSLTFSPLSSFHPTTTWQGKIRMKLMLSDFDSRRHWAHARQHWHLIKCSNKENILELQKQVNYFFANNCVTVIVMQ